MAKPNSMFLVLQNVKVQLAHCKPYGGVEIQLHSFLIIELGVVSFVLLHLQNIPFTHWLGPREKSFAHTRSQATILWLFSTVLPVLSQFQYILHSCLSYFLLSGQVFSHSNRQMIPHV